MVNEKIVIESQKPYLVNVPVKINIWIRPECQRKQFEVLKQARPSILFVTSDGGRTEKEWEAIYANRKLYDKQIDWNCTVYKLYMDENLGMYAMGKKRAELVWNNVDRCVSLEDDIIPSVSFFRYCAELLEKYKDDQRIECICGMNHLGKCENVHSDYFFSRQGSIWGTATWKRVYEEWQKNEFLYGIDPYIMALLRQRTKHNKIAWKRLCAYSKQDYYEGHVPGSEFWIELNMYAQNRLQIIPKVNMINNIGCTEDSNHSGELSKLPRGIRRVFNMETYEMDFPMKHAKYVIPDIEYEKKRNRIMGYNTPFISFSRRVENLTRRIVHGDFVSIKKSIDKKLFAKRYIEK